MSERTNTFIINFEFSKNFFEMKKKLECLEKKLGTETRVIQLELQKCWRIIYKLDRCWRIRNWSKWWKCTGATLSLMDLIFLHLLPSWGTFDTDRPCLCFCLCHIFVFCPTPPHLCQLKNWVPICVFYSLFRSYLRRRSLFSGQNDPHW